MHEFIFKSYGNSKQTVSYCEIDKCNAVIDLRKQLDQLKAENEELKETLKTKAKGWANVNDKILEEVRQMVDRINCYKQTLAEIKEIAEKGDMPPCMEVNCNCTNCEDEVTEKGSRCMQYSLKQILQKISEVEDEQL